jgi:hypothetical protein
MDSNYTRETESSHINDDQDEGGSGLEENFMIYYDYIDSFG